MSFKIFFFDILVYILFFEYKILSIENISLTNQPKPIFSKLYIHFLISVYSLYYTRLWVLRSALKRTVQTGFLLGTRNTFVVSVLSSPQWRTLYVNFLVLYIHYIFQKTMYHIYMKLVMYYRIFYTIYTACILYKRMSI